MFSPTVVAAPDVEDAGAPAVDDDAFVGVTVGLVSLDVLVDGLLVVTAEKS